ncbi:RHS repeat-associated core domain-containing protein [Vibrio vulnificus]|uniref:RHS repeat-associated core domain-containing protein n=3 Tax=Vibrio vulnificus TaxID=672 RepID=UPI00287B4B5D|nr:RHS repeat-associated core domain-containing protein [Vibrio vulnificus]MDS1772058.1 RHS repeat-associated core domain-containing protein [Vibrio vulnificus]
MSQNKHTELMSSAQAAELNFSTDNVKEGNCKECSCEVFVRCHYDDGSPIKEAPYTIVDSKKGETTGQTDENGLLKVINMPCGGYDLYLEEGSDTYEPTEVLANNPAFQSNPEYAAITGEYFALYVILNRKGYLTYDADDSDKDEVDVDGVGIMSMFGVAPDGYEEAYKRFWELHEQINDGPTSLKEAVNRAHCGLAGEVAGQAKDNEALILFCEVALGFVPVVGQAMDLYDLGGWGWKTYEGKSLDEWHWAEGALIALGFIPGLGDAGKKIGLTILDTLKKADPGVIQLAIKKIRSLSNGNIVKYLLSFGDKLDEVAAEADVLLNKIINGLTKVLKDSASSSWIVLMMKDEFAFFIKALKDLKSKIKESIDWMRGKIDEFTKLVSTRIPGTTTNKNAAVTPQNANAGKADPHRKQSEKEESKSETCTGSGENKTNEKCEVGEPVDLLTGKAYETREDFVVSSRLPLVHERYYQSMGDRETGLLGVLWRSSWDISLTIEGSIVKFIDKDYSTALFDAPYQGSTSRSDLMPQWRLHRGEHGDLFLKNKNGLEYHFEYAVGTTLRLTKQQDAYGNATQFVYDRGCLKWVVLCDGRLIQVETQRNRIQTLTLCEADKTPTVVLARYSYDKKGFLLSVRADAGRSFDYQYSKEGYLTRWNDLSQTWVEHDYDEKGRSIATRCSGGYWDDGITYDDENHIHYYHRAFGGTQALHLDDQNRPLQIVDEYGNPTKSVWQDDLLISQENALGETVQYTYDDWGNVTSAIEPNGVEHAYEYNEQGWLLSYTNPMGAVWSYEYNTFGDVTAITDPEARQTQISYTEFGQRATVTGPDGSTTHYSYYSNGLLARVEPPVGYGMDLFYDELGRLIKRVTDNKQVREWVYENNSKQPCRIQYEDGTHAYFEYDIEGNLTKATDALGNSQHFTYGPFDKLSKVIDPLGAVTHYHYNAEAEFAGVINRHGQKWYYDFDKGGRVSAEHHYDARVDHYQYDAAGRLNRHIKPDGVQHCHSYDPSGKLLETVTLDHNELPLSKAWYEYDAASRLTYTENGDAWVSFAYSPSGLLLEENLNGTSLVHEYDEHGRRIGSSGSKTARQYQWTKHQLQQLSVGEHTPLQFAYHPSGQEQTRATEQGFSLHHQWSETGLLLQQQLGRNGDSLRQYQYDALDRLVGIDDAKRGKSRFSLNANGQVQAVRQQKTWESQQRFVHLFGYDSELNLNQQGFATEYGDSNVVSLDDARVKRQSRQYDKAGRVLDTGRFRYHYDKCGRVVEKTEYKDGFRPKTTRFVWNGDDRLTHIELPDGGRYRYRYDPLGRRVAKECLSTQRITEYLWDGANIVQHSQKTADGSVIQEIEYLYEPETFRPLAQVTHKADQASQLHYIVTDHAGTPQELCSENGDVVWQGEQALWGHYQQKNALPNHGFRENAHNDELYCDLRYQGQIEDRESGLYYNVNRYYDADSGQYLSPDPIGFAGGLRPQAYVFNPLDWVDPLGLAGEAHEGKGEGTTRVRHYTNRKGSKAIEQDGVIKAQDNNRVYVEPANKKALSQVSAEDKYQIKRGKGRDYVETDVPDSQLEWVKNPRYGTPELTVKGDLLLKNAKFFRRK